jgi:V/A-type H+-transporting ATPase subunit K
MKAFMDAIFSGPGLTLLGIFLAITFTGIGSARGVAIVGQTGSGLLTEQPDMFGKVLGLQALPMTQGIYGLLTAFFVMLLAGFFDGSFAELTMMDGVYYLVSCLPIAIVGWISAIYQARVAASGVLLLGKQKDKLGQAITSAALVETYAIFALLITLMLVIAKG